MSAKSSFSATAKASESLSLTGASEKFLKFGFSKGFEESQLNEVVRTENKEITESVKQVVTNNTSNNHTYQAIFNLIKVNAIAKLGSVITIFSADSEIVFGGFKKIN